jgi:hypothetical protein
MTKYYAVRFEREVPTVEGMTLSSSLDGGYTICHFEDSVEFPFGNLPNVELTEDEATVGIRFYGEGRDYRKAYSDIEGLVPDNDTSDGSAPRTKVYHTEASIAATLGIKRKILMRMIEDEYSARDDQTGKAELISELNALETVHDMLVWREQKFGIEAPVPTQRAAGMLDENGNRINKMKYGVQF